MSHTLDLFFQAATMKSQLCDWSVEMSSINIMLWEQHQCDENNSK